MREIVKEDILKVLGDAIDAVKRDDLSLLQDLSNHTIHDASIFQEDDPLTLAVVMYALAKVMQKCSEKGITCPVVIPSFKKAIEHLEADDDNAYRAVIKRLLRTVEKRDDRIKIYAQKVIEKAKIKKASKLHEHGISVARTAELLGISQWEVQKYIGRFRGDGSTQVKIGRRLKHARSLFR